MSARESTAVAVARRHVEAWGRHDFDAARASLSTDVHVLASTVDPMPPRVDTTGIDAYMEGLVQFAQGVLPGTTEVTSAVGDDSRALLEVTSRVKFGPDSPEMTVYGARLYLLDDSRKIKDEQVVFFVLQD
jgi:SnoaL-like domain